MIKTGGELCTTGTESNIPHFRTCIQNCKYNIAFESFFKAILNSKELKGGILMLLYNTEFLSSL